MNKDEIYGCVTVLAQLNVTQNLTTEEFFRRREIVDFLEKEGVIELGVPREAGKFLFTSKEWQDLYLLKHEEARSTDDFYYLIKWPESQVIMDEEWFNTECHLADVDKDPSMGSSAYFVPVRRMKVLNTKLEEIQ
jgi:hypothetical protein